MGGWTKHFPNLHFTYFNIEYTADVVVHVVNDGDMHWVDWLDIRKVVDFMGSKVDEKVWEKLEPGMYDTVSVCDLGCEEVPDGDR